MNNKFGLIDPDDDPSKPAPSFTDRLATFAPIKPRASVDLPALDAAAAQHGFVSREVSAVTDRGASVGRRRRAIPSEPTRHLAIRLTASAYDRFVAYADRYKLTYHDALTRLMDSSGE